MRKRKNSEESSEMEVDNEERKVEVGENDVVDDEDEMEYTDGPEHGDNEDEDVTLNKKTTLAVENPFLDSFYSLSAPDPKERSRAAQVMLYHCLLGPSSNSKDSSYAFRRLLNGLCSGRAAARQGNASALASFLKIAFQLNKMNEIRSETESHTDSNSKSLLNYVRDRLLSATDSQKIQGKKKGSEERDYYFGRLFGILGFIRSSILLLPGDEDEIREVASALVLDLVKLFWHKRWMREPAAHGITAMVNLFYGSHRRVDQKVGLHLVEEVIIPKILIITQDERSEESDFQTLIEKYCAEQIGIGTYIQSQSHSNELPFPLDQPLVSTKTLPWIGQALSETSAIVQPRTHFVWDTLWCYLTEKIDKEKSSDKETKISQTPSKYCTRNTIPLGEDRVVDVIDAIVKVVVEEKLLRIVKGASVSKSTHERKSLALCIVKNLSGVPFVSSISGPTLILIHCDAIENIILTTTVVRSLFLEVISAGKKRQDACHLLKPLALNVLGSLVESTIQSRDTNRQLACVKAFTNCHPRFDTLTKTRTVLDLLLPSNSTTIAERFEFLDDYFEYLECKFLTLCSSPDDNSPEAHGYVELLYTSSKLVLHQSGNEEDQATDISEYKQNIVKRVLGFFMSTAFFDCSTVIESTHKIRGKKPNQMSAFQTTTESALKVKTSLQGGRKIAYPTRMMISSRFFSLASEFVMTATHESKNEESAKIEKDTNTLVVLEELCDNWIELESKKAERFLLMRDDSDDDDDDDDNSPERIIKDLRSRVTDLKNSAGADEEGIIYESKKRCITGITVLAIVLHLHRLSCGSDDEMDDDPDADEEEDEENICNAIAELEGVSIDFFESIKKDSNPLLGLSEICANILSSPLGSGDIGRGAAPKLVREAVKYAWLGGLKLASAVATEDKTLLDDAVVNLLMDAIGASKNEEELIDGDAEMDENTEDDGSTDESDDDLVFSKASKVLDDPEDLVSDVQDSSRNDNEDKDTIDYKGESDIELDPSKLHTMLEDENFDDVDDIVLEHHEGADAALAKLIKLKQDARKAGQEAREKIEASNQLRCMLLVDLLLGRPDLWNKLFQCKFIVQMVVPLLECRKRIGISTQRAFEGGGKSGPGDKKALLSRLTGLIKQKLSKIRLSSMPLSSPVAMDVATSTLQYVMKEAKNSKDKDYLSCCSCSLIFLLRLMPSSLELVSLVSTEYGGLVCDWSTKRINGASLLEDLISQRPALAQASLSSALSRATQDARGFYLKLEAYRLLSLLFTNKFNEEEWSEMERIAHGKIHEAQDNLLSNINKTLTHEETIKPKFAKAVCKTLEKMLPFVSSPASEEAVSLMTSIKVLISGMGEKQNDLSMTTANLVEEIDARLKALDGASKTIDDDKKTKASASKKKTKKKKKKKR